MIDSSNLISLLEENDTELQITGLELINANIELIWHEVSESIPLIEPLSEFNPSCITGEVTLEDHKALNSLASIVLSKLYFHLGKLNDALKHALRSGDHFTIDAADEFTTTLLHFCIDKYIKLRTKNESKKSYYKSSLRMSTSSLTSSSSNLDEDVIRDDDDDDVDMDITSSEKSQIFSTEQKNSSERKEASKLSLSDSNILVSYEEDDYDEDEELPMNEMETIVTNMVRQSLSEGEESIQLSLGLSIDCRREDLISELLEKGGRSALEYCRRLVMEERIFMPLEFRVRIIKELEKYYRAGAAAGNKEDYFVLIRCLVLISKPKDVSDLLIKLTDAECVEDQLIALQIAFDLASEQPQKFLLRVLEPIKEHLKTIPGAAAPAGATTNNNANENSNENENGVVERYKKLMGALSGNSINDLSLDFLYNANHSDLYLISYIKMIVESQSNVGKSTGNYEVIREATLAANALMHAGTSVDVFVRKNIEWVAEDTYWSTFSATAGLGSIHKGHHKHAFKLLGVYLPSGIPAGSHSVQQYYSEGGALYALGLIHAGNGAAAIDYLKDALRTAVMENPKPKDMVIHGACLGLGLAGLGTADHSVTDQLWDVVIGSNGTTPQEAASLAIGLVNVGSALPDRAKDMLTFARGNPHDRVVRNISIALALTNYGRQESADSMIEDLTSDKNPEIRIGGMYAIGLAYCGTCAEGAISRLLGAAVSDVSDDVRRAALTALGFVLHKTPQSCPHLVALLTDSFNPHVRYGASMALGISCAGTALPEAISLLEPMMNDPVDFVRQGAMIAMSMVLIQTSKKEVPSLEKITKKILDRITEPHEEVMSKMGAILAMGIMNAGGRNVTIDRDGFKAAAGLTVFSLYWYWFSSIHFLTLAFKPTAVITLDQSLNKISVKLRSNAPPSMFAYPENMKAADATNDTSDAPASVLSYGKNRLGASKQSALEKSQKMEVEEEEKEKEEKKSEKMEDEKSEKKEKEKEEEEEEEAKFEIIEAPCRVTMRQRKVVKFEPNDRYIPVKKNDFFGIVIVNDLEMDKGEEEEEEIIIEGDKKKKEEEEESGLKARPEGTRNTAAANADDSDGKKEPQPPAPFTLSDDD